jgi:phage-related protein (TIGR01555 family)
MQFEKWLMEMAKEINHNPQNHFESSVQDFGKQLQDKFVENVNEVADKQLDRVKAIDEKLKAYDGKELSDDERIEYLKGTFDRKKAQDSYDNSMLLLGNSDTMSQFDTYSVTGLLYNWYLWTALYMSSWVFARAIDKPASDMIRNGWKIKIDFKESQLIESVREGNTIKVKKVDKSEDVYSTFYKKQKGFIQDLIQSNKLARLYGGAVAGLIISGEKIEEYEKPLTSIKPDAKLRLIVADRWQNVIPSPTMVKDVTSDDWNTPDSYTIRSDSGDTYKLHHSRCLRFTNGTAPTLIQRMLIGWGIPLGVRIFNEINRDEKIKNIITSLLAKQSLEIVQTAGMRAYANGTLTVEQEGRLDAKLELINRYRHFNSILFLDKDDVYTRQEGSAVGTMAQLMDSNSRFVAGSIPMPQVLLYGDQQKGLSGNAVDDMRLYEDELQSQRYEKMLNQIIKLSKWILMWMQVDFDDIDVVFNSSISYTKQEIIDKSKAMIETYQSLKNLGIYDEMMIAQELKDAQDELIFGSALTDDKMEELEDKFDKKRKRAAKTEESSEAGSGSGELDSVDLGGSEDEFLDMDSDETLGGGNDMEPTATIDELDITEDFIQETDLGTENIPAPTETPEPVGGNQ